MGYQSRLPNSNERINNKNSDYLDTNDIADEFFLLLSGDAKRCKKCRKAVMLRYLDSNENCPRCA